MIQREKHGKFWYAAQTVLGVIHSRKGLGKDFAKVKVAGLTTTALAASTAASIKFMGMVALITGPFALAAPLALGAGALGAAWWTTRKIAALKSHYHVQAYIRAKEQDRDPLPVRAPWQSPNARKSGFGKKALALTGGLALLAGGAGYIALDGKIENLSNVFKPAASTNESELRVIPDPSATPPATAIEKPTPQAPQILP